MSSAAGHSHCNTSLTDAAVLPEGTAMMSYGRNTAPLDVRKPTQIPREAGVRPVKGGGFLNPGIYVDVYPIGSCATGFESLFRADSVYVVSLRPC